MSEGSAEKYAAEKVLTRPRYVLEETLRLSDAHRLGHNEVISVTQLTHLLITKSLGVEAIDGEPKFPLCELVANEVAAYEQRTGKRVPESFLEEYGWSRLELGDMVKELGQKPLLRIVPRPEPAPAEEKPAEAAHEKPAKYKEEHLPDPENGIRNYLREINAPGMPKYDKMGRDEKDELVRRMRRGEMKAAFEMVRANLNLVVPVAKLYLDRGATLIELITFGNEGLIRAASPTYDPSRSQFSTYATWWIKQSIRRSLAKEQKMVRIPSYMIEAVSKYLKFKRQFTHEFCMPPAPEDVAGYFGIELQKAKRIMRASMQNEYNPNTPSWRDKHSNFIEDLAAKEEEVSTDEHADAGRLHEMMEKNLSEREQLILRLRFGIGKKNSEGMTLESIGERLGLTRERVRQIEAVALRKLRVAFGVISEADLNLYLMQRSEMQHRSRMRRQATPLSFK